MTRLGTRKSRPVGPRKCGDGRPAAGEISVPTPSAQVYQMHSSHHSHIGTRHNNRPLLACLSKVHWAATVWRMNDPFAGLEDQGPQTPAELRASLLRDARRGYTPLLKVFVQKPSESPTRHSLLGEMVTARQETALRLYLLSLALVPLAESLPLWRWAELTNANPKLRCSHSQLRRAIHQLEERGLAKRTGAERIFGIAPLREDGSGDKYVRPGAGGADVGKGFFIIPDEAWTTGLIDNLRLPGLAMFLVCLHDTHQRPSFQVPLDKMSPWYGISERTAERGYKELEAQGVLRTHAQTLPARNTLSGTRTVTHRALVDPYSMDARRALQAQTRGRVRKQAASTSPQTAAGAGGVAP